ncbi:phage tail protein [Pseudomonas viridiflava]|uniref:phage tail protein n=1 Tax=Pseudomonas viridiflava TaxID=33069 RepID=UPI001F13EB41|nr:phage tail protein [Pseudomonas viridiflava]WKW34407.1 phage tail protein [Pseudomonas viridiflava]
MPWYKSGTVAVTQNSNAVIGSGTAFIANSRVGDGFRGPDGGWYEVTNIASDTAMSISPNYQGATNSAGGYALAPLQGYVKESADALRALVLQYGQKLAALGTTGNYDTLPVAKGGTGATTGPTALNSLGLRDGAYDMLIKSMGLRGAPVGYNVQGFYVGWNGNGNGEVNYICNRGGALGGHTWWSVNSDNTAAGPVMTYSYAGVLSVSQLSVTASPIAIASGGTSATTAAQARTNLGLGSAAIENTVPVSKGGTGGTDSPSARANLGLGAAALAAIVGVVSQASGVPTGAIMEYGTASNGSYLRFADGTQVCWTRAYTFGPAPANTTVNSPWTPPLPFASSVSAVFVSLQFPQTSDAALINRLGGYQVGGNVIVQGNFSIAQAYTLAIFAIGRWY